MSEFIIFCLRSVCALCFVYTTHSKVSFKCETESESDSPCNWKYLCFVQLQKCQILNRNKNQYFKFIFKVRIFRRHPRLITTKALFILFYFHCIKSLSLDICTGILKWRIILSYQGIILQYFPWKSLNEKSGKVNLASFAHWLKWKFVFRSNFGYFWERKMGTNKQPRLEIEYIIRKVWNSCKYHNNAVVSLKLCLF